MNLFLDIDDDEYTSKVNLKFYSIRNKKIISKDFDFYNYFYCKTLLRSKEIVKSERLKQILLSDGTTVENVYKIYYNSLNVKSLYRNNNQITYELNIPRSVRFCTTLKVRFLEVFDQNWKIKRDLFGKFPVPISLLDSRTKTKVDYIWFEDKLIEESSENWSLASRIIVRWKASKIYMRQFDNCFFLSLHDFCLNFLRITENMHKDRIKVHPLEYFIMKCGFTERLENMKMTFEKYFAQVVCINNSSFMPLSKLFGPHSKKLIADYIFLSSSVVALPPQEHKGYNSSPYMYIKRKGIHKNGFVGLDYDSMYPSIMLKLFAGKKHLDPYYTFLTKVLRKKRAEKDPQKKEGYKVMINSIYGSFGAKYQNLVRAQPEIASQICASARELMERTVKLFRNVIYCNNDSIVIPKREYDANKIEEWNRKNDCLLRVEFETENFFIINKNVRLTDTKCIGWRFNSWKIPVFIRKEICKVCLSAIKRATTWRHFKNLLDKYKVRIQEKWISIEELMVISIENRDISLQVCLVDMMTKRIEQFNYIEACQLIDEKKVERQIVLDVMWKFYLNQLQNHI